MQVLSPVQLKSLQVRHIDMHDDDDDGEDENNDGNDNDGDNNGDGHDENDNDEEEGHPLLSLLNCPSTLQELNLSISGTFLGANFARLPPNLTTLQLGSAKMYLRLNDPMKLGHLQKLHSLEIWGSCGIEQSLLGQFTGLLR